jgi:hypothetical protein
MLIMITVPESHIKLRKKIAQDMANFEKKGGKIKQLDQGKVQDRNYVFSINPNGPTSPDFVRR